MPVTVGTQCQIEPLQSTEIVTRWVRYFTLGRFFLFLTVLNYTHTERHRQHQRQIGSHWNTLWHLEMGGARFPNVTMYSNGTQSAVAVAADSAARCGYTLSPRQTIMVVWGTLESTENWGLIYSGANAISKITSVTNGNSVNSAQFM